MRPPGASRYLESIYPIGYPAVNPCERCCGRCLPRQSRLAAPGETAAWRRERTVPRHGRFRTGLKAWTRLLPKFTTLPHPFDTAATWADRTLRGRSPTHPTRLRYGRIERRRLWDATTCGIGRLPVLRCGPPRPVARPRRRTPPSVRATRSSQGRPGSGVDLGLDRPVGVAAEPEVVHHALGQRCHSILSEMGERMIWHRQPRSSNAHVAETESAMPSAAGGVNATGLAAAERGRSCSLRAGHALLAVWMTHVFVEARQKKRFDGVGRPFTRGELRDDTSG